MGRRHFVLFGIAGVVAAIVAMTVMSLNDNLTYYLYPNEAIEQRAAFDEGQRFRLAGLVSKGSLVEEGTERRFNVTDGAASVSVVLTDIPPPLFAEEVPVLLEGHWSGDIFLAERAIIRHDENYEVPDEGNYADE